MPVIRLLRILYTIKLKSSIRIIRYLLTLKIPSGKSIFSNLSPYLILTKLYSISTASVQPIIRLFCIVQTSTLILLSLTSRVQQILAALVIILKRKTRLIKRVLIITARAVPITIIKITIIERILVALKYKKGGKDGYYRLY